MIVGQADAVELKPHRHGTFKVSKDPAFAAKVADVVGLYLEPPGGAVVCGPGRTRTCDLEIPSRGLGMVPCGVEQCRRAGRTVPAPTRHLASFLGIPGG